MVRVKSVVRGHGGPRVEIPMDARGQSVNTSGQKRIIVGVLLYYQAHEGDRSRSVRGSGVSGKCGF